MFKKFVKFGIFSQSMNGTKMKLHSLVIYALKAKNALQIIPLHLNYIHMLTPVSTSEDTYQGM